MLAAPRSTRLPRWVPSGSSLPAARQQQGTPATAARSQRRPHPHPCSRTARTRRVIPRSGAHIGDARSSAGDHGAPDRPDLRASANVHCGSVAAPNGGSASILGKPPAVTRRAATRRGLRPTSDRFGLDEPGGRRRLQPAARLPGERPLPILGLCPDPGGEGSWLSWRYCWWPDARRWAVQSTACQVAAPALAGPPPT